MDKVDSCTNFAMVTNHTVAPCVITLVLNFTGDKGGQLYQLCYGN